MVSQCLRQVEVLRRARAQLPRVTKVTSALLTSIVMGRGRFFDLTMFK